MTPTELRTYVEAWQGVEKFARELDVSNRTVSYWLAGKRKIRPSMAKAIRTLKQPKRKKNV
jgi:DNA-binding transcriptional regulator YiaG